MRSRIRHYPSISLLHLHIDAVNSRPAPIERTHRLLNRNNIDRHLGEDGVQNGAVNIHRVGGRLDGVVRDHVAARPSVLHTFPQPRMQRDETYTL